MKDSASVIKVLFVLIAVALVFGSLSWVGILPLTALQVLLNTLYTGVALFLVADILINAPVGQEQ